MPGGAGELLDGAYRWFVAAANAARDPRDRDQHIADAARALNNLAVWALTRSSHPDAPNSAVAALQEAERLMRNAPGSGELRAGVYFNLGQLASASADHSAARHYLGLARSFGMDVPERVGESSESVDVRLGEESAEALEGGKTPLMFWAAVGDVTNVRVLIMRGAEVNAVDHDGDTALLYAISKGHLDIAELLLRHGADPNIAGDSGYPIRTAASRGWTQMVRALLVRGAIVDAPSSVGGTHGVTAAMVAAGSGSAACLRVLLEFGANPSLRDSDGDDALFYARSRRQAETEEILQSWGNVR